MTCPHDPPRADGTAPPPPSATRLDPGAGGAPRALPPLRSVSETVRAYLEVRDDVELAVEEARGALAVPFDCPSCTTASCCTHDMPKLTPGEAAALVEIIEARPELADVPNIVARQLVDANARYAAGQRDAALGAFPCPFLSADRRCRIYAERPWACVVCQSKDRRACEADATAGRRDAWDPLMYLETISEVLQRVDPDTRRTLFRTVGENHLGMALPLTLALAAVLDLPGALGALGARGGGRAP